MAYITTETVAKIRSTLKAEFGKGYKFSVRRGSNGSSVTVSLMASPLFDDGVTMVVNQYYIAEHHKDHPERIEVLTKIDKIIGEVGDYWDKSDIMTDYFHTSFYYNIEVGQWNKPHIKVV